MAPVRPRRRPSRTRTGRGDVDRFVLARMEAAGLEPSPPADVYTLIRRVYLDLVGLTPQPEEVDAVLADVEATSLDEAYERLVDRLLDSPHYGERWARRWLDLARYADTNGYEKDRERSIWPYRDWVIRALNRDMPFDEFTVAQLAGDMLPDAGNDERIATGFHRNSMQNEEGGIDPLEYRYYAMVDRVATTGTTWLGLSVNCAQCHSHKFDPISQHEYYSLMAFLNNADEPELDLPDKQIAAEHAARIAEADALLATLADQWPLEEVDDAAEKNEATESQADDADNTGAAAESAEAKAARRQALIAAGEAQWLAEMRGRAARWQTLVPVEMSSNMPILTLEADGSVFVSGDTTKHDTYLLSFDVVPGRIAAIRIEALPDDRLPAHGPGMTYYEGTRGDFFLSEFRLKADGEAVPLASATHSYAANQFGDNPVAAQLALDGDLQTGWSIYNRQGERHEAVFVLAEPLEGAGELQLQLDFGRHFASSLGRFRISVTDTATAAAIDLPVEVQQLMLVGDEKLSDVERQTLWNEFLLAAPELAEPAAKIRALRKPAAFPTSLVMRERPAEEPRATHLHERGEYLRATDEVEPAVPEVLHHYPDGLPANRLGFARWLTSPENPLTARVVVNRHWAALFGRGIVRTVADFGVQGEPPTHPELLDWLAVELVDGDWSLKRLHKLLVMSATYRQSSEVSDAALAVDPDNRLLARAPRTRLEAELIRDSVLQAAGVLSPKMYGPGVRPVQPAGVTEVAYGSPTWTPSAGEDGRRRSIYTFVKRSAPFAMHQTFDAPSGEFCTARRDVSNTPLQALALLNDVMFTDAARALGTLLVATDSDDDARVVEGFRRVLTRPPSDAEQTALLEFVTAQRRRLATGELDARKIMGLGPTDNTNETAGDGDESAGETLNEQAAWTTLARVLFSLDETITRN
ncbi:MAG: DUF1549 and DUF1553 domain-containing protein [Pirellulales bacterium]